MKEEDQLEMIMRNSRTVYKNLSSYNHLKQEVIIYVLLQLSGPNGNTIFDGDHRIAGKCLPPVDRQVTVVSASGSQSILLNSRC